MQKIIKSIIVFLFIFVLLVFYNSLNRETNYSTDYLVGNKLANINLKSLDLFLKNIGLAGGFLFIVANGTKEWSVDKEKKYVRL